jgi:hypothetical protein
LHGATDVHVSDDGTFWLTMGDASAHTYMDPRSHRALDLNQPHGKVLRFRRDGRGLASNPHYDPAAPSSWRSRVYAHGFRSPFRMTLDPWTGTPVVADVGWYSFEEVNVVRPGQSYGWPCWEGPNRTPQHGGTAACQGVGHTPPGYSYPRSEGVSVTGGVFYTGDSWPAEYKGAYLFGDYGAQRLQLARFRTDGSLAAPVSMFGTEIGRPVEFETAPNGDVLFADIGTGKVKRLSYQAGNRAPTAPFTTRTDPDAREVVFDARDSTDLDGDPLSYIWSFGDGTTGTGMRTSRTYPPGRASYDVRLTVTDPLGKTGELTRTVYPDNHEPTLHVPAPVGSMSDGTFAVGDPIKLTATADDAEDGDLGHAVQWQVDLYHCRGTICHSHPGSTGEGRTFASTFDDHGGETTFIIRVSVEDKTGARAERTVTADPALRLLRVTTSPAAAVTLNGNPSTQALVAAGSMNSVAVARTAIDGYSTFSGWADGGTSPNRNVLVPDSGLTLTTTYVSPIAARYAGDAGLRALLGKPVGAEQSDAGARWQVYEGGRIYWSAATGPRAVYGAILQSYLAAGGHLNLGVPAIDETGTPDGRGRFNHFAGGASVYWSPGTGAHAVYGAIRAAWAATGWENGPLGYPVTSERGTPDGVGRFNHFSNGGSVYWTPTTGAHPVYGAIRARWAALGWERGYLGYPTSGEFAVPEGRRSNLRGGYITWMPRTGAVDRPW